MPSITIRDIPAPTRDELAARAARSGRSLQEYLRLELIELARRPDQERLLETISARKRNTGTRLDAATIVRHRNAERR